MPEKKYFVRLFGAFAIGLVSLIIAGIVFFLLIPFFIPLALLLALGVVAVFIFILLWLFIYLLIFLGTALYYLSKPMEFKKKGRYSIRRTREAGRRQKGRTK